MARILNAKGEPIVLNKKELLIANYNQKIANALGAEINITTLTTLIKKVSEQRFFTIPFADYVPVETGEGAWSTQLTTFTSFQIGDKFSTGVINTGANQDRLAGVTAGVQAINTPVRNWAKKIHYTRFELEYAQKFNNWDLITALETSRKTNYDQGLQEIAFLGLTGDSTVLGLLNQSGITTDTTTIPKFISAMTAAEFNTFLQQFIPAYRLNAAYTVYPNRFVIPEADYNGLASMPDATYPLKSKLEILEAALKTITMRQDFKILPAAYGNKAINGTANNIYALYNYDSTSIRMNVPVPYQNTQLNSMDSFGFQNVGLCQFTGVTVIRSKELLYFTNTI